MRVLIQGEVLEINGSCDVRLRDYSILDVGLGDRFGLVTG